MALAWQRLKTPGARYALSMIGCHVLNGIAGVLAMRWLEPIAVGWWNTSQLVRVPLDATRMGVLNGMNREYPFLIGAGEPQRAHRMLEAGLAHTLLMLVLCQAGVGVALFILRDREPMLLLGIAASSVVWSAGYYTQFIRSMLRTKKGFGLLGTIELLVKVLEVGALVAIWKWGYYGLVGRAVIIALLTAWAFARYQPVRVLPRLDWDALRRMLQFGRHAFVTNYVTLLGQQAERILLLASVDGVRLVGLYSPAIYGTSFLQVVPGAFQSYFYPQLVESYARQPSVEKLAADLFREVRRCMLLMIPISAFTALGMVVLIRYFLPQFARGETAAVLVCLAGPFYPLRMCTSYYAALRRWRDFYIYSLLQAILPYAFIWLWLRAAPPLEATALGFVAATIATSGALGWMTVLHSRRSRANCCSR